MKKSQEKIAFNIPDEITYFNVMSFLQAEQIWFTARKIENTLYPSMNVFGVYGQITVLAEDGELVSNFLYHIQEETEKTLEKEYPEEAENHTLPLEKNRNYTQIWLLVYAIVMTIVALRYWYLNRNFEKDKNFIYEWNAEATSMVARHVRTNEIAFIYYDKNYNLNFEKIEVFSKGYKIAEHLDNNEDGYPDRVNHFNKKGEIIEYSIDIDQDHVFEQLMFVLENGDTLRLYDHNRNLMYEKTK